MPWFLGNCGAAKSNPPSPALARADGRGGRRRVACEGEVGACGVHSLAAALPSLTTDSPSRADALPALTAVSPSRAAALPSQAYSSPARAAASHIHTGFFQGKRHNFPGFETPPVQALRSDCPVIGRTYGTFLY